MKKTVYTGVDIFKLFAAIGVVGVHSGALLISTLGRLGVLFLQLFQVFSFSQNT